MKHTEPISLFLYILFLACLVWVLCVLEAHADCTLTPNLSLCTRTDGTLFTRTNQNSLVNAVDAFATNLSSTGALLGSTVAALPAAGTVGRLRRLTDGAAIGSVVVDDGAKWTFEEAKSLKVFVPTDPRYNAKGDNVADDTVPLRNCLADAVAANGIMMIPQGTYKITGALTSSSTNSWQIRGQGRGSKIVQATANTPAFTLTDVTDIVISDLYIQGPNTAAAAAGVNEEAIQIKNSLGTSKDVVIQRVRFDQWGYKGIDSVAQHTVVRDCVLIGQNPPALVIAHVGVLIAGSYSIVQDNFLQNWSNPINSGSVNGHTIQGNKILLSATGNDVGIYDGGGNYSRVIDNYIESTVNTTGIKSASFGAPSSTISQNTLNFCTIEVQTSTGAVVSNNTLFKGKINCNASPSGTRPQDTRIIGNTLRNTPANPDPDNAAIEVRGAGVSIIGNSIILPQGHGILIGTSDGSQTIRDILIEGNTIEAASQQTHNTYDSIHISLGPAFGENVYHVKIVNNILSGTLYGVAQANSPRWGILDSTNTGTATVEAFGNTVTGHATGTVSLQTASITTTTFWGNTDINGSARILSGTPTLKFGLSNDNFSPSLYGYQQAFATDNIAFAINDTGGAAGTPVTATYNSARIRLFTTNSNTANSIFFETRPVSGAYSTKMTLSNDGILDVNSTTGAFIPPRLTTVQRDALTAVDGMLIYNTTTGAFNYRKAGVWTAI